MTRPLARTAVLTMSLVAATACGVDTESGRPVTASSSGTPEASNTQASPNGGGAVPSVTDPLDTEPFISQPCSAISARLLIRLGLSENGVPRTEGAVATIAGPSCAWSSDDTLSTNGVALLTGNKNGLADIYTGHDQGEFGGYFEETIVDGRPGVFASSSDFRERGMCTLVFGATDSLAIQVTEQGRLGAGSCDRVAQVAVAVIRTLKGEG